MATDTKGTTSSTKQLKVDNWSNFFLQRLQLLFAKGDFCDLTLKFHTGQELKVHRLVLNTCTTFFETMEITENTITLPETLPYGVVQPIINFLYSGRLEFKSELHPQLVSIANSLNITILAKLLVTHKNDNGVGPAMVKVDGKKVPQRTFLATRISGPTHHQNIGGRKLPIWRQRSYPMFRNIDRKPMKEEEPRPTRFEWPEDGEGTMQNLMITSPSFAPLSYDSEPVVSLSSNTGSGSSPTGSEDSLPQVAVKRRILPSTSTPIPEKFFKSDSSGAEGPSEPMTDDDDDDGHFETIHTYGDSDEETAPDSSTPQTNLTPKPILKPISEATPSPASSKKVRFSLAEGKENEKTDEAELAPVEPAPKEKEEPKPDKAQVAAGSSPVTNHAKIIAEVLKKYPDLVKSNKNIKLKISTPGSSAITNTLTIDTKKRGTAGKSSYVVVKSSIKSDKTSAKSPKSSINWQCDECSKDGVPMKFETYFQHKKHMLDVHEPKGDSFSCKQCGYKTAKKNVYLYHMYTKHEVVPPKHINFPKCDQCDYVALTESLLAKHKIGHKGKPANPLTCNICQTTFKAPSTLQAHILTCKGTNICPRCKKNFRTNTGLNAHAKICPGAPPSEDESNSVDEPDDPKDMNIIEVPIMEEEGFNKETTYVQLPPGLILAEGSNVTLLPSSESEGLNNVATSIATSIGLTVSLPQDQAVILIDPNSEYLFQGNSSVVMSQLESGTEYIVPDILSENSTGEIYSESLPYTVVPIEGNGAKVDTVEKSEEPVKEMNKNIEIDFMKAVIEIRDENDRGIQEIQPEEILMEGETVVEAEGTKETVERPVEHMDTERTENGPDDCQENSLNEEPVGEVLIEEPQSVEVPPETTVEPSEPPGNPETSPIEERPIENQTPMEEAQPEIPLGDGHTPHIAPEVEQMEVTPDNSKAESLVKDWGFDNEEDGGAEDDEDVEDPDRGPSRMKVDI